MDMNSPEIEAPWVECFFFPLHFVNARRKLCLLDWFYRAFAKSCDMVAIEMPRCFAFQRFSPVVVHSQVPYGSVVYIAGWIQGISAQAHRAIEWLREAAREMARRHDEHQTATGEYKKRLEKELEAALGKLLPSKQAQQNARKVYGKTLRKIRQEMEEQLKKGAKTFTLAAQPGGGGGGGGKKQKVAVSMNGEVPPQLEPSPPIPDHMREAYDAWEASERAAGREPPVRVEMEQLWLPEHVRSMHRITTRDWIAVMMHRHNRSYGYCIYKLYEEFGWLEQWAKERDIDCW